MSKSKSETNAVAMLKKDHATVKQLFDQFEEADGSAEKRKIMDEALNELKIHATLEEEIFYPAVREKVGEEIMNEADEEHHVARVLIAELDELKNDDGRREAKFKVLAEGVKHHIKEEEGQMLPRANALDIDFEELGDQMLARKDELQEEGVPPDAEHMMISGAAPSRKGKASSERTTAVAASSSRARKDKEDKEKTGKESGREKKAHKG